MSKSIALVFPKSTFLETALAFPPLGLFYIASRLESLGHEVDFFDMSADDFPEDVYDEIWVSATSPQMAEIKKYGNVLKTYDAKGVLGGASAWADPASCMNLGYDLVVGGEADEPSNMQKILNTEKGYLLCPVSKTLDWVLPPLRKWCWKYKAELTSINGEQVLATSMFTSRGCILECAFCESGRHGVIWDNLMRFEPLNIVEYQLAQCQMLGYGALFYYDDILPISPNRTRQIMKLHKDYKMIWRCFMRSDIIHKHGGLKYLEEMRDGGLVEVFIGVESADNRIKEGIHKKTTIEQDNMVLDWCRELGIRSKTSLIMGLPGESKESMETTRRWILENRPDRVQVGRLIPFKGTPLTKHPEQYDLVYEEQPPDEWFYMGYNELQESFVSTSNATREEIDAGWHSIIDELKREGIPS